MTAVTILGMAVVIVGLLLVVLGSGMAWASERVPKGTRTKGMPETLGGLASLANALAKHPVGIRLVFLGIVLIIVGGIMAGVGGLVG